MMWQVERIIHFGKSGQFKDGLARFRFHGKGGAQYVLANEFHWIGLLCENDHFFWTAGKKLHNNSSYHFDIDIHGPTYISECHDGSVLVTGKDGVHKLNFETKHTETLLRVEKEELGFIGNAVVDNDECICINDVCGCKILLP